MFNTTTHMPFLEITACTWTCTNFQGVHKMIPNSNCVLFAPCCVVPCVSLRGARHQHAHLCRGSAPSSPRSLHRAAHAATRPTRTVNNKYLWASLNFGPCVSDTYQVYQQVCKVISGKNNSREYPISLKHILYNAILKSKYTQNHQVKPLIWVVLMFYVVIPFRNYINKW